MNMKGYFTVEAAMLFPVILLTYFFLFYIGFYQYDRCLTEQDMRLSLLRGSRVKCAGSQERLRETAEIYRKVNGDKTIAVMINSENVQFSIAQGRLYGSAKGNMSTPILSALSVGMNFIWDMEVEGARTCRDPVLLIRTWERIRSQNREEPEYGDSGEPESSISEDGNKAGNGRSNGELSQSYFAKKQGAKSAFVR